MSRKVKLVLSGESGVGKSSIISRFYRNEEPHPGTTVGGALFRERLIQIDPVTRKNKTIDVDIWDTAGQERFRSMSGFYFRNCDYCLLVFDLNDRESFVRMEEWRQICEKVRPDGQTTYFVIGNKSDVEQRQVTRTAILEYCQAHQIARYLETSAKEGVGIGELHEALKDHLWSNFANLPTDQVNVPAPTTQSTAEEWKLPCAC
jgi:small GTP-binding protein